MAMLSTIFFLVIVITFIDSKPTGTYTTQQTLPYRYSFAYSYSWVLKPMTFSYVINSNIPPTNLNNKVHGSQLNSVPVLSPPYPTTNLNQLYHGQEQGNSDYKPIIGWNFPNPNPLNTQETNQLYPSSVGVVSHRNNSYSPQTQIGWNIPVVMPSSINTNNNLNPTTTLNNWPTHTSSGVSALAAGTAGIIPNYDDPGKPYLFSNTMAFSNV